MRPVSVSTGVTARLLPLLLDFTLGAFNFQVHHLKVECTRLCHQFSKPLAKSDAIDLFIFLVLNDVQIGLWGD